MYNKIFEKVTSIANQRHILTVDLVKINRDKDSNFDKSDENVRNMRKPSIFQYSCMVEILCLHIQCIYQLPCFNIAGMIRAYSRKLGHACDFSEKGQKKAK